MSHLKLHRYLVAPLIAFLSACDRLTATDDLKSFAALSKIDSHVHLPVENQALIQQAKKDNFCLLEINVNYDEEVISLVQGHEYPSSKIKNGFGWEFDNTHPYEVNTKCDNWEFYEIDNGVMLNCYPENIIFQDVELLKAIKEY